MESQETWGPIPARQSQGWGVGKAGLPTAVKQSSRISRFPLCIKKKLTVLWTQDPLKWLICVLGVALWEIKT
jgi:hypothetical protein